MKQSMFIAHAKNGYFCTLNCTHNTTDDKNNIHIHSVKEALAKGYLPCPYCKPLLFEKSLPKELIDIFNQLEQSPLENISISTQIETIFRVHYNMTWSAFLKQYQLNHTFKYASLSKLDNISKQPSFIAFIQTPIGNMVAHATRNGIALLEFINEAPFSKENRNNHLDQLERELDEYFSHQRKIFSVALDPLGTPFQKSVWQVLRTVPYGETCSYQQEAYKLNKPRAIRAVATANGNNPISIIIPCHRIINSDGGLGGYSGGLWRKSWLLNHEKLKFD